MFTHGRDFDATFIRRKRENEGDKTSEIRLFDTRVYRLRRVPNKFGVTHGLSIIRVTDFIVLFIGVCATTINGAPHRTKPRHKSTLSLSLIQTRRSESFYTRRVRHDFLLNTLSVICARPRA